MLAGIHLILAILAAACGGLLVLVIAAGAVLHRPVRFARDRVILVAIVLVAVAAASGLVILGTGGHPDDALHLLYAVVALLVLPVARFLDRLAGHRALAVGVGGAALALLVLRLFQTG